MRSDGRWESSSEVVMRGPRSDEVTWMEGSGLSYFSWVCLLLETRVSYKWYV